MSRSTSSSTSAATPDSASLSESTTADATQLVTDEIPWSWSSSSSGSIPMFSTLAWLIIGQPPARGTFSQVVLKYFRLLIRTMHSREHLTIASSSALWAYYEIWRRVARMIMRFAESQRMHHVSQISRMWRWIWSWKYGRNFFEEGNLRLAPFVHMVTRVLESYFNRLRELCLPTIKLVQEPESTGAINWGFRCFIDNARQLDAWRLVNLNLRFERLQRYLRGLLVVVPREWVRFVDAFFGVALGGRYTARSYRGLNSLVAMASRPEIEAALQRSAEEGREVPEEAEPGMAK